MLQYFDPVSYEEQKAAFLEQQTAEEKRKKKIEKKKAERNRAVDTAHALGLKVWDPTRLSYADGQVLKDLQTRTTPAEQQTGVTATAVEDFLGSAEGKRMLNSMEFEFTGGDSGLRALLAIESDKYQAEKTRGQKLERAVREVQAQGMAILTVMKTVAPQCPIAPEWELAFNRTQPADSPMRQRQAVHSARSQSSDSSHPPGSASRQLILTSASQSELGETSGVGESQ